MKFTKNFFVLFALVMALSIAGFKFVSNGGLERTLANFGEAARYWTSASLYQGAYYRYRGNRNEEVREIIRQAASN